MTIQDLKTQGQEMLSADAAFRRDVAELLAWMATLPEPINREPFFGNWHLCGTFSWQRERNSALCGPQLMWLHCGDGGDKLYDSARRGANKFQVTLGKAPSGDGYFIDAEAASLDALARDFPSIISDLKTRLDKRATSLKTATGLLAEIKAAA